MAQERLAPDAILSSSGYTLPTVTSIQDDPDSPDALWLEAPTATDTSVHVSFPTPVDPLVDGAGNQEFRVLVRKNAGRDPQVRVELWADGQLVGENSGNVTVTSGTGQIISVPWNSGSLAQLVPAATAADVECLVEGTAATSGPSSDRSSVEVGAIEWNATTEAAGPSGSGSISHSWTLTASGSRPSSGSGSIGHSWALSAAGSRPSAGSGSLNHSWTLSAAGSAPHSGSGSLAHSWTLAASGTAPLVVQNGSGTIDVSWTVSGSGTTTRSGSGSVGHSWTLAAAGSTVTSGSGTLGLSWLLAASGSTVRSGSGSVSHVWTLTASGGTVPERDDHATRPTLFVEAVAGVVTLTPPAGAAVMDPIAGDIDLQPVGGDATVEAVTGSVGIEPAPEGSVAVEPVEGDADLVAATGAVTIA